MDKLRTLFPVEGDGVFVTVETLEGDVHGPSVMLQQLLHSIRQLGRRKSTTQPAQLLPTKPDSPLKSDSVKFEYRDGHYDVDTTQMNADSGLLGNDGVYRSLRPILRASTNGGREVLLGQFLEYLDHSMFRGLASDVKKLADSISSESSQRSLFSSSPALVELRNGARVVDSVIVAFDETSAIQFILANMAVHGDQETMLQQQSSRRRTFDSLPGESNRNRSMAIVRRSSTSSSVCEEKLADDEEFGSGKAARGSSSSSSSIIARASRILKNSPRRQKLVDDIEFGNGRGAGTPAVDLLPDAAESEPVIDDFAHDYAIDFDDDMENAIADTLLGFFAPSI